jgi:hypothetical protein
VFGLEYWQRGARYVQPRELYEAIAAEVLRLIEVQAEPFWQTVVVT